MLFPYAVLVLACVAQAASLPNLTSPLGPVVNLGYAAFAGNTTAPSGELNGPVTFFGGIPYAQPPVGNLRFRAPRMLDESFDGDGTTAVTDARNYGAPCIQQPAQVGVGQEDCLTLEVWAPSDAKEGDNLPVLYYIHGGGFFDTLPQTYPLYELVNQSNPKIIAVSVTYRLNLLGFLASDALQADGDLNNGLLDQRAGMEWVQRHIASFGGNPNNITIDGESAGGASVVMHIVSYGGSKPVPFTRGIAQSIGFGPTPLANESEATFQTVVNTVGCTGEADVMSCLRNASVGEIVAAVNANSDGSYSPVVDGPDGFLPDLPSSLIASGNFSNVEFVGGHCTNDGRTFVGGSPDDFVTDQDIIDRVLSSRPGNRISNATKEAALALYPAPNTPGSPFTSQFDRASTMAGDIVFTCMDWFLANALRQKGEDTFTFRFNAPNPVLLAEHPFLGTMHTSDLFFLMMGETSEDQGSVNPVGAVFTPFNDTEEFLSEEMIGYWTSFISSGDPASHRLSSSPAWTGFTSASPNRMVLSRPENLSDGSASMIESITSDEVKRCSFWMSSNVTAQTGV